MPTAVQDPFDKLVQDISTASSPFDLGRDWNDIQTGIAAAGAWKKTIETRLAAVEAQLKKLAGAGA
jgi:hypothetical protein